jgi:protein TonB
MSELTPKRQVVPNYPHSAHSRSLEGWVELEFTVSETGEVSNARVMQSSATIFEGAALSAISRWRFEPVLVDGRPVPVRGAVKFTFKD